MKNHDDIMKQALMGMWKKDLRCCPLMFPAFDLDKALQLGDDILTQ